MKTTSTVSSRPSVLKAAIKLARERGLFQFSRADVAEAAECGQATVSYHVGTMPEMRTRIVQHAVEHEVMSILADALAGRENVGVPMSAALKKRVAAHVIR